MLFYITPFMLFYNIVSYLHKYDLKKVYIQIMLVPNMHALLFCTILVFSYTFFFPAEAVVFIPSYHYSPR